MTTLIESLLMEARACDDAISSGPKEAREAYRLLGSKMWMAADRIEKLEAALRSIANTNFQDASKYETSKPAEWVLGGVYVGVALADKARKVLGYSLETSCERSQEPITADNVPARATVNRGGKQ